jgi:GNAT superfamily N-acetyltransferase
VELIFPDIELARRLEHSEARNVAELSSETLEICGGVACFAGATSPISHAIGVGLSGPVTESDLDRMEEFYKSRGAHSNIDLCPLADPTLMERLGRRGYRITEFNNVLMMRLNAATPDPRVRVVASDELEVWSRTCITGFFGRDELTAEELALGANLIAMKGAKAFLVELHSAPAAAGAAAIRDRLLLLFGDSTLPKARGNGLQPALIRTRLAWGIENGCDLATACTIPGTVSQRNYQREGFLVAYTKMNMLREF